MPREKGNRTYWIVVAVTGVLTVAGILLALLAEFDRAGNVVGGAWRFYCGLILAAVSGCIFLCCVVIRFGLRVKAGESKINRDPREELSVGRLTQEDYERLRKRVWIAFAAVLLLSAAMVVLWLNPFSVCLGLLFVSGAGGAVVLVKDGKGAMKGLVFTVGAIVGVLFMLFSGDQSDREYDYIVNGVRVSDGMESCTTKCLGGGAIAVGAGFLSMGIAYAVRGLCSIGGRERGN